MTIPEFLVRLATDPAAREAFDGNPEEYMREAGLTEDQIKVLSSGSLGEIRYAVQADLHVPGETSTGSVSFAVPVWIHWPVWLSGSSGGGGGGSGGYGEGGGQGGDAGEEQST